LINKHVLAIYIQFNYFINIWIIKYIL